MYNYIDTISVIIWIILPIFRFKKRFFLFFSLLALNDLTGRIFNYAFSIYPDTMWIPITYLLLFSLDKKFFTKHIIPILLAFLPLVVLGYYASSEERRIFVTIVQVVILLWFIFELIKSINANSKLDLLLLVMVFYESVLVFKLMAMINDVKLGMGVFYAGTLVQIFIGLFIILMRKDIKFSLSKDDIPLDS